MSKKARTASRAPQPGRSVLTAPPPPRGQARPRVRWLLGCVFLLVAAVAALLLVIEHFGALHLPGCGEGGACEQAARSVWGKVPLGRFEWPVSFLGFTYFASALVAWLGCRAALGGWLRWVVRFGALVSAGYCAIIVSKQLLCPYCLATHAGNFAFWITMETTRPAGGRPRAAAGLFAGSFVVITLVLGVLNARYVAVVEAAAEKQRQQDLAAMIKTSQGRSGATQSAPASVPATTAPAQPPPASPVTAPASAPAKPPDPVPVPATAPAPPPPLATAPVEQERKPFTGRWRWGPENAPIRIVIFTDYQCPDCYKVEQQMQALMRERKDISVAVKHFPFCTDCNPVAKRTMHQNACWAARAAEAAGMLWGNEAFFKMHEWLFARKGGFEKESDLHEGIRSLGYDPAGFVELMSSEETLQRVQEDCREGGRLGLLFTPLVYINGVELRGILAPDALRKTVEELAQSNPPPGSPLDDNPPPALEKFLGDWMDQKPYERVKDSSAWKLGPDGARIQVLVWGDYQDPFTTEIDATIREFVAGRTDAQYTFRMYPFNNDCNEFLKDKRFEHSCRTARAAEAAGRLGGVATFWKVHAWLMSHRTDYSDELLRASAPAFGLDPDALFAEMEKPAVASAIQEDIRAGKGDGLRFIPRIIINGRWLQRFNLEGENVVLRALEAAAAE